MYKNCSECQKQFLFTTCNSINNLSSYCGLVDPKIRASDKDLPVYLYIYIRDICKTRIKKFVKMLLIYIFFSFYFSESSPSFVTSPSTSPSTTPLGGSAVVQQCTLGSLPPGVSLTKPVPRPLGSSPLFSGPNSLQSLLYRHPYLSGNFPPIATS